MSTVTIAPSVTTVSVAPSRTTVAIRKVPIESVWVKLLPWQNTERLVKLDG